MNYHIGQTFEGTYPPEAAVWCNKNNAKIERVDGVFTILAIPEQTFKEKNILEISNLSMSIYNLELKLVRCMSEISLGLGDIPDVYGKTPRQYLISRVEEIRVLRQRIQTLSTGE